MSTSSFRHVFVYGTLRRGEVRDINQLFPAPRWRGTARVPGTLYHLGAYPGVVLGGQGFPSQASAQVHGEVYAISPKLEQLLDEIEEVVGPAPSGEYGKREMLVRLDATQEGVVCLVYEVMPQHALGRPLIASGDWVRHRLGED